MTDVLSLPVLVLNRYLAPVQVTTVKRAIVLLYGGVALALDEGGESYDFELWRELPPREGDDAIPIVGGNLRVPRVVHLLRYDRTPRVTVRLTRRNLMFRDAHQCQYCGKRPPLRELNIDHVMPAFARRGRLLGEPRDSVPRLQPAQGVEDARGGEHAPRAASVSPEVDDDRADPPWQRLEVQRMGAVPEGRELTARLRRSSRAVRRAT